MLSFLGLGYVTLHKAPPLEQIYFYFTGLKINCWPLQSSYPCFVLHDISSFRTVYTPVIRLMVISWVLYSTLSLSLGGIFVNDLISLGIVPSTYYLIRAGHTNHKKLVLTLIFLFTSINSLSQLSFCLLSSFYFPPSYFWNLISLFSAILSLSRKYSISLTYFPILCGGSVRVATLGPLLRCPSLHLSLIHI